MIETEQTVTIAAPLDTVWNFARDIRRWAELMPGLQDCDVIDDDNSRWTLKVGVGGLVRTVKVDVHVDEWDGPGRVLFSYKLQGDPVQGGGSYLATANGAGATDIVLQVRVEGGGPMAPMWEAMGRPLLPQLARGFAGQLKEGIEQAAGIETTAAASPRRSVWALVLAWLRGLFGKGEQAA